MLIVANCPTQLIGWLNTLKISEDTKQEKDQKRTDSRKTVSYHYFLEY